MSIVTKDQPVWSRGRKEKGAATGNWHHCQLEGCNGMRIAVRWPNGRLTFPCTKGMTFNREDDSYELI